jgi:hypothetical protein
MAQQITSYEKMAFASTYTRANGQPIDDTVVWNSLSAAEEYAKTNKAYTGQIITVLDNNKLSKAYIINKTGEDSYLTELTNADEGSLKKINIGGHELTEENFIKLLNLLECIELQ